jgi:hypothetical protein
MGAFSRVVPAAPASEADNRLKFRDEAQSGAYVAVGGQLGDGGGDRRHQAALGRRQMVCETSELRELWVRRNVWMWKFDN